MRKFVVHTRALPGCCKTTDAPTVVEVEGEILSPLEEPSVMWMPKGEFFFRILKPVSLHESHEVKQADGTKKKEMIPSVYHSHAIYHSLEEAKAAAEQLIHRSMAFEVRKGRASEIDEEKIRAQCAAIETLLLH